MPTLVAARLRGAPTPEPEAKQQHKVAGLQHRRRCRRGWVDVVGPLDARPEQEPHRRRQRRRPKQHGERKEVEEVELVVQAARRGDADEVAREGGDNRLPRAGRAAVLARRRRPAYRREEQPRQTPMRPAPPLVREGQQEKGMRGEQGSGEPRRAKRARRDHRPVDRPSVPKRARELKRSKQVAMGARPEEWRREKSL
eukprot:scaffold5393_cov129-Isochrysis_galbana.AAC.4